MKRSTMSTAEELMAKLPTTLTVRTVVTFIESPLRVYVNRKCNDQTLRDMEELQEERVAALIGARVVSVGGEKA